MDIDWECGDAKNQNERMKFRVEETRYTTSQDAALVSTCLLHLNSTIMELIYSITEDEKETTDGQELDSGRD